MKTMLFSFNFTSGLRKYEKNSNICRSAVLKRFVSFSFLRRSTSTSWPSHHRENGCTSTPRWPTAAGACLLSSQRTSVWESECTRLKWWSGEISLVPICYCILYIQAFCPFIFTEPGFHLTFSSLYCSSFFSLIFLFPFPYSFSFYSPGVTTRSLTATWQLFHVARSS